MPYRTVAPGSDAAAARAALERMAISGAYDVPADQGRWGADLPFSIIVPVPPVPPLTERIHQLNGLQLAPADIALLDAVVRRHAPAFVVKDCGTLMVPHFAGRDGERTLQRQLRTVVAVILPIVHRIAPITSLSSYSLPPRTGGLTGGSYEVFITSATPARTWLGTADPAAATSTIVLDDGPNLLDGGVTIELLGRAAVVRTGDERVALEDGDPVEIAGITYRLRQT